MDIPREFTGESRLAIAREPICYRSLSAQSPPFWSHKSPATLNVHRMPNRIPGAIPYLVIYEPYITAESHHDERKGRNGNSDVSSNAPVCLLSPRDTARYGILRI